jgi:hypothetical protein
LLGANPDRAYDRDFAGCVARDPLRDSFDAISGRERAEQEVAERDRHVEVRLAVAVVAGLAYAGAA